MRHAVMLVALLVAVSACGGDGTAPTTTTATTVETGRNPGPEVTVTGRVTRTIESRTFELGRSDAEPLVVLSVSRYRAQVGTVVKATGRVRTLRVEPLESELGIDLDGVRLRPFEGARVLVASVVEPSEP